MLSFISLINLLFMYNYLFLNDEFAIMVCLLLVFSFLLISLKKYIISVFFFIFDNVYYHFFILLQINAYLYENLLKKNVYLCYGFTYNKLNLFVFASDLILKKKIKENIIDKFNKRIRNIFCNFTVMMSLLNYLKSFILSMNNITKNTNIRKISYLFLNIYYLKNSFNIKFRFIC